MKEFSRIIAYLDHLRHWNSIWINLLMMAAIKYLSDDVSVVRAAF
jgi:hypothetical protein